MPDPPDIDRIQSYRVCGRKVYGSMPAEELNEPLEDTYLSVGEPPVNHDDALTIYDSRKPQPEQDTHLTMSLNDMQALLSKLPKAASVYADGQIFSVMDDNEYATRFTGSTPLNFSPYPNSEAAETGLCITFGQPGETGSQYILTPAQTAQFIELLTAVNICHPNSRYTSTIDKARTFLADGTVDQRKTLGSLFR